MGRGPLRALAADAAYGRCLALRGRVGQEEWLAALSVFLRYADDAPTAQVAWAMDSRTSLLFFLDRPEQALASAVEMARLFSDGSSPDVEARALQLQASVLTYLDRHEEAIAAADESLARLGSSDEPEMRERAALALLTRWLAELGLDREREAEVTLDLLRGRFGAELDRMLSLLKTQLRDSVLREQMAGWLSRQGRLVQLQEAVRELRRSPLSPVMRRWLVEALTTVTNIADEPEADTGPTST